ncbi:phage/plasmid primase, P4 family [Orenia marismortui]|uniref:DNA primase catalytic core n=1 Tax=Orenia marismortui TaxID=46469 RepID=A0A4R8GJK9_9FIRM|nr:phage/plasmid primase, P4 family [Orenia marismortui]TDX44588.1 DNA primase catalytic core [Orenia marismortui]
MNSISQNSKKINFNDGFDSDFVEELKQQIDIKEVIENETGQQFKNNKILCPFHNERTASFGINPNKQLFHCFGCGTGGDVIRFIELYKSVDFREAIAILANDFNIDIRTYSEEELEQIKKQRKTKQSLKDIYTTASEFFQKQLKQEHIDFLKERYGLTPATIKKAKIGYCKAGLLNHLRKKGYNNKELEKTGLFYKKDGNLKDRIFDSYTIPYLKNGNPIYFKVRLTNEKAIEKYDKYLNLIQNADYVSDYVVNPLFLAKTENNDTLILVEGELDALSATELIKDCDVIALGKAGLSQYKKKELFKLIKRYDKVVIINDTDQNKAGIDGAIKTAKAILKATGIICLIGKLEQLEGHTSTDISDYNLNNKDLEKVISNSLDFIELKIKEIQNSSNGKQAITRAKKIYPLLALVEDDFKGYYIELIRESVSKVEGCSKSTLNKSTIQDAVEEQLTIINNEFEEDVERPWFEFTRNGGVKFKPAILGKHLLFENNYITLSDNIFQYKTGVYAKNGETDINKLLMKDHILADDWEVARADSVISYIKRATKQDAIELFEDDTYDNLVNVKNGMIDLETISYQDNGKIDFENMKILKHSPKYQSFSQLNVEFNPKVNCKKVDEVIESIILDKNNPDPNKAKVFWEFIGWIIFNGQINLKKACLLVGDGDNGKSVLIEFLTALLGKDNISATSLYDITNNDYAASDLFGKIANLSAEMTNKVINDIETFKQLTGGDLVRADQKYKEPLVFKNKAKLMFALNSLPKITDYEEAFFNRLIIIRCPNTFKKDSKEYDPHVLEKITTEKALSHALNRSIEGFARLIANGLRFTNSKSINKELREYQAQVNTAIPFIDEVCNLKAGAVTRKSYLYDIYTVWAKKNGYGQMSKRKLTSRINQGFNYLKTKKARFGKKTDWAWEGLELKPQAEAHYSRYIK